MIWTMVYFSTMMKGQKEDNLGKQAGNGAFDKLYSYEGTAFFGAKRLRHLTTIMLGWVKGNSVFFSTCCSLLLLVVVGLDLLA